MTGLSFDPLLPWALVASVAALGLLVALWSLWRGLRGWFWRGLAGLAAAPVLGSVTSACGRRGPDPRPSW